MESTENDILRSIAIALDKESEHTKLCKIFTDKNERRHAIVILQEQDAIKLTKIGRIFTNLLSSTVRPYHEIKRCFKCQGHGHTSLQCNNKDTCGKCGQHHDTRKCTETTKKCINCCKYNEVARTNYNTDHWAFDNKCHLYQGRLKSLRDMYISPKLH
ncbi:hypothetical protein CDAR_2491 [Caerostris darwini]|uniref:Uncharacterized protein n=1 Tax=Caerostris darwini TaxID=1538125 RepID=A0AAV4MY33_9ARAC|nr:hypothetical protein CDAR_2491 [Caerostris darwini]